MAFNSGLSRDHVSKMNSLVCQCNCSLHRRHYLNCHVAWRLSKKHHLGNLCISSYMAGWQDVGPPRMSFSQHWPVCREDLRWTGDELKREPNVEVNVSSHTTERVISILAASIIVHTSSLGVSWWFKNTFSEEEDTVFFTMARRLQTLQKFLYSLGKVQWIQGGLSVPQD